MSAQRLPNGIDFELDRVDRGDKRQSYFPIDAFKDSRTQFRHGSKFPARNSGESPGKDENKPVNTAKGKSSPDIGNFTQIPRRLFASGTAADLGPSGTVLYVALCEHANRHGSNEFRASDKALASDTGMGTRTIIDARKRLAEEGLIALKREKGESYVYTLSKQDLPWVRLEDRLRPNDKRRGYHAVQGKPGAKGRY